MTVVFYWSLSELLRTEYHVVNRADDERTNIIEPLILQQLHERLGRHQLIIDLRLKVLNPVHHLCRHSS